MSKDVNKLSAHIIGPRFFYKETAAADPRANTVLVSCFNRFDYTTRARWKSYTSNKLFRLEEKYATNQGKQQGSVGDENNGGYFTEKQRVGNQRRHSTVLQLWKWNYDFHPTLTLSLAAQSSAALKERKKERYILWQFWLWLWMDSFKFCTSLVLQQASKQY